MGANGCWKHARSGEVVNEPGLAAAARGQFVEIPDCAAGFDSLLSVVPG